MTSVVDHDSVKITPESLICGDIGSYLVEVTVKTPLINNDQFHIRLPANDLTLPNQNDLSCTPV